jgi:hypothetical protein
MKSSRLLLIIACFGIICVLFSSVVSTFAQDETGVTARVIPHWSNETPAPGSTVRVDIFLINDYSEPLTIDHIGLHVDWMEEDSFYGYDLSDDPVTVQSNAGDYFPPIDVEIPQDASIGSHQYFVGVEGILANSTAFTWDSEPRILQIQSSGEDGTDGGNGGDGGTTSDSHQDQMLIIVGVAAVAAVALLIIFMIYRRRK